mmetsp:Transcript_19433/g.44786  ORF Transcript_19433/g.44786 Transcript_19433/m.44786 type:complete len:240 (-) Transcript_19433:20-739(-)|eukprot:CAMPEP_0172010090 /NCGR_PEP_ID=MMETSP1041-20130122/7543_1 /TAXON_ID=464988 /ORGANISM="Hemiselmis andersenii, Strain CCMP439" /LENGTH=239 /DNA_ID=CAMNT_0012664425 /DNA_START=47 /DNA_END=766 /DNA_ORIENTATION=-
MSVFPRVTDHSSPTLTEPPRLISAAIHLAIPFTAWAWIQGGYGSSFLAAIGQTAVPLSAERTNLYLALSTYYSVRWAFGMMTLSTVLTYGNAVQIGCLHIIVHNLLMHTLAMVSPGVPAALNWVDYLGAGIAIFAGVLQHGAEAQRWLFKRNPANRGKLHTVGLFGQAQFINHTGHVLRDISDALLGRSLVMLVFAGMVGNLLVSKVVPETQTHMRNKYGDKYAVYIKQTPSLYIPGVW